MAHCNYQRLCGGTFFVLLLQAIKQRSKARDRYAGGSDGLTDTDVLIGLIRVAQPQYVEPAASTFAQNTSAYKSCRISSGTYLPFSDEAFVSEFDKCVINQYPTALAAMSGFVNTFIDIRSTGKHTRLVKALLELIKADASIDYSDSFYTSQSGQLVTKDDLLAISDVCLPAFLLGIWHFIVLNRRDNAIGRNTYESWHTKPEIKGAKWIYCVPDGEGIIQQITVTSLTDNLSDVISESSDKVETVISKEISHTNDIIVSTNGGTVTVEGKDEVLLQTYLSNHSDEYYNLFVMGAESYDHVRFIVPPDRALTEAIEPDIKNLYAGLDAVAIAKIKTFPSLFMSEIDYRNLEQIAYYGFVTDIKIQENGIKISFKKLNPLPQHKLLENYIEFAFQGRYNFNELSRTHWTIKRINLLEELQIAGLNVLC